ncbi:DUF885 domain-containing protein [Stackebrandtia nassauensis]|uniref:DUF885 domain-containing protein n=1 Tax=Stackebrandtia nassauensis (strain DSM 44728 / CIP 108903 / NRRL B-16338 / NBRC 102104 / LLR-40K-21) TaxID=446470 RepID=D3Q2Y4_STANL|nr:DUF885 domain-containing protein [Stackebrandtia nassauensis]ADD39954.1 protein of unknown function DUF885 [Stackebrandtia nassauensis DSM 44728]
MRQIDEIAETYVAEALELSPMTATYMGVEGHDHEFDDLSPEGLARQAALVRDTLSKLSATEPVDERERVAKEGMEERLGLELERHEAGDEYLSLNVISSGVHNVRQVFDMMNTDGQDNAANIAARLNAVPQALRQYTQTLREEAAAGRVAALRQVSEVAGHCDNWNGAKGDDFWNGLIGKVTVDGKPAEGALAEALGSGAAAARAATAEFASFLREELAPKAPSKDAVGRDAYSRGSRYFLGAAVDLEETYAWGWQELHRIETEMAAVANQIKPGATVDEAVAILDADPARSISDKHEFRDWMQQLADATVADMADKHFDIPEPVRAIECMIAPTADGAIYYTPPSEDFSRPGRMWWSVPDGQDHFAKWREVTTVYHEGVPGHHLQIGQTAYRSELLNRYQRQMLWCSGHGEGWALYSERLMDDLGYLADPGDKLGMLDGQAFRATRVIVDIGVHLELEIPADNPFGFRPGQRWNAELAWEFLRAHCRIEEEMLKFELNRYLGWPGQAPSYKVGERIWLAAREDYKRRKGAEFNLKQFHTDALNLGALGLEPFQAALARL